MKSKRREKKPFEKRRDQLRNLEREKIKEYLRRGFFQNE